jgi:hypothetical protein
MDLKNSDDNVLQQIFPIYWTLFLVPGYKFNIVDFEFYVKKKIKPLSTSL